MLVSVTHTATSDHKIGVAAVVRNRKRLLEANDLQPWDAVVVDRFYSSVLLAIELHLCHFGNHDQQAWLRCQREGGSRELAGQHSARLVQVFLVGRFSQHGRVPVMGPQAPPLLVHACGGLGFSCTFGLRWSRCPCRQSLEA
jgi:hypothetical protein